MPSIFLTEILVVNHILFLIEKKKKKKKTHTETHTHSLSIDRESTQYNLFSENRKIIIYKITLSGRPNYRIR
jgi:hypothetical protein